ncbi:hypothetical protein D0C27_06965 [Alcaligenes faecalis]|nr:hypothetical protein D0C27_06965 [Alcaligenes faecalis]
MYGRANGVSAEYVASLRLQGQFDVVAYKCPGWQIRCVGLIGFPALMWRILCVQIGSFARGWRYAKEKCK